MSIEKVIPFTQTAFSRLLKNFLPATIGLD